MLLSILLPTYNRKNQIKRQIEYFINEKFYTYSNVEIIVSNNCSDDGTNLVLNDYKYDNLRIFSQNSNIGSNNNFLFLINKSRAKFIWIVGDDDELKNGLLEKVIKVLTNYPEIGHLFINFNYYTNKGIEKSGLPEGNKTYFNPGELFQFVSDNCGFGAIMFITSNIYKKAIVEETNSILEQNNELDNMALSLGYGLNASRFAGYCIFEPMILDDCVNISWSRSAIKVHCRDMLAIYDIVSQTLINYNHLLDKFVDNMPRKAPEFTYLLYSHRYNKNNYAMLFFLKHYPHKLIIHFFEFIYLCAVYIVKHMGLRRWI